MIDTILWDNDGILVDTEGLYYQATNETMQTRGHTLTPQEYIQNFLLQNTGAWHLLDINQDEIPKLKHQRNQRYTQLLQQGITILPGIQSPIHEADFSPCAPLRHPRARQSPDWRTDQKPPSTQTTHPRTPILPLFM